MIIAIPTEISAPTRTHNSGLRSTLCLTNRMTKADKHPTRIRITPSNIHRRFFCAILVPPLAKTATAKPSIQQTKHLSVPLQSKTSDFLVLDSHKPLTSASKPRSLPSQVSCADVKQGDDFTIRRFRAYDAAGTGLRSLMSCSISTILTEKPHSLSYQENILTMFLSITIVESPSKMDE